MWLSMMNKVLLHHPPFSLFHLLCKIFSALLNTENLFLVEEKWQKQSKMQSSTSCTSLSHYMKKSRQNRFRYCKKVQMVCAFKINPLCLHIAFDFYSNLFRLCRLRINMKLTVGQYKTTEFLMEGHKYADTRLYQHGDTWLSKHAATGIFKHADVGIILQCLGYLNMQMQG